MPGRSGGCGWCRDGTRTEPGKAAVAMGAVANHPPAGGDLPITKILCAFFTNFFCNYSVTVDFIKSIKINYDKELSLNGAYM